MKTLLALLFSLFTQCLLAQPILTFHSGLNQIHIDSRYGKKSPYASTELNSQAGFGAVLIVQPRVNELLKPNFELGFMSNSGHLHVYSGGKGSSVSRSGDFHFQYLLLGFHPEFPVEAGRYEVSFGFGFRLRLLLNNEQVNISGSNFSLLGSSSIMESAGARKYLKPAMLSWLSTLSARRWIKENWAIGLRATYEQGGEPGENDFDTGNVFKNLFFGVGLTYKMSKSISINKHE